ncbi:MAG: right-handed parallel beta-helix repeat-containing protein [Kiritimatiellaeota bacterium]|nr:right-handed parallel beta-helix repeat-containing protein [Kiritimatiellota bacterium]
MKTRYLQRMLIGLGLTMTLAVPWASAVDRYVAPNGTGGGTSWTDTHSNLIAMVALAGDNDTVYVTNNAKYYLTNQIIVRNAITVRSWGPGGILDPTNTIIDANIPGAATTNRHFILSNYWATVAGFTLTNGSDSSYGTNSGSGGSIVLQYGMVTNCIIMRNYVSNWNPSNFYQAGGGGIFLGGNTASSGGVWNCTISGNSATKLGGGILVYNGGPLTIANCTISDNTVQSGGGISAYMPSSVMISNCWIVSNYGSWYGGGIAELNAFVQCHNSFIMGNTAGTYSGGGFRMYGASGSFIRNCLIANNVSMGDLGNSGGGGEGGIAIQNCTIASNAAPSGAGGVLLDASINLDNTIIWGNSGSGVYSNWCIPSGTFAFTNCCTSPIVVSNGVSWVNTISNNPQFVSATDFRLQSASPCINAGTNETWMMGAKDLDGHQRIDHFGRQVDIGAYEYLAEGTLFVVH